MDFCMQTPIQSKVDNGYCSCADGYFGSFHMGEGKCYCYLFNGLLHIKLPDLIVQNHLIERKYNIIMNYTVI